MEEYCKTWINIPNYQNESEKTSSKPNVSENKTQDDGMIEIIVNDQDGYAFSYKSGHIPRVGEIVKRVVGWTTYHYTIDNVYHIINGGDTLTKIELTCSTVR